MKRIVLLISLVILFGCSDKYKGRYELYKCNYNKNHIAWLLFDIHDGSTVEIKELKIISYPDNRGEIKTGFYIEDRKYSNWNFATFNTFSFDHTYSSLEDAIAAADSGWFLYKKPLEDRYTPSGKNLIRNCYDCEEPILFKRVDMP